MGDGVRRGWQAATLFKSLKGSWWEYPPVNTSIAVGGLVPAPVKASSVERALTGQTLNVENIMAASSQVANDLGSDVIGDFYASAEYRRAMAAVEIRHALFHITGEAHVGSRAESVLHRV